jgi:hypothetical protein
MRNEIVIHCADRTGYDQLLVNPHGRRDGEEEIVAARLKEALSGDQEASRRQGSVPA